jgi:hypothetical protein
VVAIDGTVLSVPDTAANLTAYARHRCPGGGGGYPQLRLSHRRIRDIRHILETADHAIPPPARQAATLDDLCILAGTAPRLEIKQACYLLQALTERRCY